MTCIRRQVELLSTEFRAVIVRSEQASAFRLVTSTSSVRLARSDLLRTVTRAMPMTMLNAIRA